ncbi:hypothetical protein B0J13DRAFT_572325 [Dactylonectria estremocensis]|uniref:LITAF domain-containing protein n=1 Tax=Dactylonectria estremocensis TaxID=1079267 RepID=A0A9P9IBH6_9HYPO|nr:hypothetical protein B0J13DRAFT_572325 [Dactylonectria estremocensis]
MTYVMYPGQHGVVTPGMNVAPGMNIAPGKNVAQVAQMPPPNSQYRNATPIAALGRAPAPVDCPSCGQLSRQTSSGVFILYSLAIENLVEFVWIQRATE